MRIVSAVFAAAVVIGTSLISASPTIAAPIQPTIGTNAIGSQAEPVGYYYHGRYYSGRPYQYHSPEYRYHSPEYRYRKRYGLHSKEYKRNVYRRKYYPEYYYRQPPPRYGY